MGRRRVGRRTVHADPRVVVAAVAVAPAVRVALAAVPADVARAAVRGAAAPQHGRGLQVRRVGPRGLVVRLRLRVQHGRHAGSLMLRRVLSSALRLLLVAQGMCLHPTSLQSVQRTLGGRPISRRRTCHTLVVSVKVLKVAGSSERVEVLRRGHGGRQGDGEERGLAHHSRPAGLSEKKDRCTQPAEIHGWPWWGGRYGQRCAKRPGGRNHAGGFTPW
mmetsp:Transcript_28794/g.82437  ORF Transcript_28794/g.82437 Transcript_28794/m.82437 type:complete len:218 (-) Transcript_28794:49-702(-)